MQQNAGNISAQRWEAWIGLSLLPTWGPGRIWQEVGSCADPLPTWSRHRHRLPTDIAALTAANCTRLGIKILTWDSADYPANLRSVPSPPPVLYYKGTLQPVDTAAVAIVGTRRASPHAVELSFRLARDLAGLGITIVSGLAAGVDAAAHRGALAAQGRTLAVIGSGLDRIYPRFHAHLASQIVEAGAVISQFPPGTGAQRHHFPIRNRVLAGLALGTVVIEAPVRSGALITADCALNIGRPVMVCPGDVLREHTAGSNNLLREGATPVLDSSDVVAAVSADLTRLLAERAGQAATRTHALAEPPPLPVGVASQYRPLWQALSAGAATVDELCKHTGWSSAEVRCGLTHLEMLGYVQRGTGDAYHFSRQGLACT